MKARVPLSKEQKKALKQEMYRQAAESTAQWDADYEAMMLWCLHLHAGYGKKRLLDFRELFIKEVKALRKHYEISDAAYPAKHKLKQIGIDIDALQKQDSE